MNAQISFIEGSFSLIHIPKNLYSTFLEPILKVLHSQGNICSQNNNIEGLTLDHKHGFLNFSITPVEVSVVCHSSWAKSIFQPFISKQSKEIQNAVSISKDTYLVLSVINAGMNAGSHIMELTSPLALAGIPIFYITTYYSDFILVPSKDRKIVVAALKARGFEFLEQEAAFVTPGVYSHARGTSQGSDPPSTPPPSNVAELQERTFQLLKKRNVTPFMQENLTLVQCSGKDTPQYGGDEYGHHRPSLSRHATGNGHHRSWLDDIDTKLYTGLTRALVSQPKFLSITLAQEDPPSLLLDKDLLDFFGDALVGDLDSALAPLFLDLANLPLEATGIVSGVAGTLVQEMRMTETGVGNELSYLSTARAGAVILSEEQSRKALNVLKPLLEKK